MALSISSTVKLNTGATMPVLGFGVYQSTNALKSCQVALETGYKHIDSARYYHNEAEVADAVRKSSFAREDIYITTKIYDPEHGTQATRTAVEDSLAQTKLDYFDLILLHSPLSGKEKRLEAYKVLLDFQGKGKIKSVGVSNYGVHHMEEIKQAGLRTPAVNQIELHPWCQQKDIVDYCEANGIVVQAYCPLVRGLRMSDATLVELAKQCSKIPAQVLVRWSLQKGFVPLPKSDTPSRIKENADVYNFELDETAMAKLDALDEGKAGACQWNPVDAP